MKRKETEIERELRLCRKAWNSPKGRKAKFAWCCHHDVEIEALTEPAENRIKFILSHKNPDEQAIRLRNFRPVLSKLSEACAEAWKAWDEAWKAFYFSEVHKKDVPNHTWNGRSIFP